MNYIYSASSRKSLIWAKNIKKKSMNIAHLLLNRDGFREKKIFAVGFNKTGTTSLHVLFKSLGFSSFHGVKWRACDDLHLLLSHTCFSDGIPKDFTFLDKTFPNSKFILQVRELDTWIYSRLAHIEREKKQNKQRTGPTWDMTEHSIKHWIKQRNAYHLAVLSHFNERPSDFTIVNFIRDEAAATKICNFLGYTGKYEKPMKNVNPQKMYPLKHTEMLKKCVAELEISEKELSYDILCPSLIKNELRDVFPVDTQMVQVNSEV